MCSDHLEHSIKFLDERNFNILIVPKNSLILNKVKVNTFVDSVLWAFHPFVKFSRCELFCWLVKSLTLVRD